MLICIGGVCVPYTAVVPIILLALKWVVVKLVTMGLLPKAIGDFLQVSATTSGDAQKEVESMIASNGPSLVKTLKSDDEFRNLIKEGKEKVVCKFTARYEGKRFYFLGTSYRFIVERRFSVVYKSSFSHTNVVVVVVFLFFSWCKPCHKIQPLYDALSSHYQTEATIKFFTIDVDDFDMIANQYSIAMMPTFLIVQGETILGRYSGSNEQELQRFFKETIGRSE